MFFSVFMWFSLFSDVVALNSKMDHAVRCFQQAKWYNTACLQWQSQLIVSTLPTEGLSGFIIKWLLIKIHNFYVSTLGDGDLNSFCLCFHPFLIKHVSFTSEKKNSGKVMKLEHLSPYYKDVDVGLCLCINLCVCYTLLTCMYWSLPYWVFLFVLRNFTHTLKRIVDVHLEGAFCFHHYSFMVIYNLNVMISFIIFRPTSSRLPKL